MLFEVIEAKSPRFLKKQLNRPEILSAVKPGMRIAVTAGSRGIDNIVLILRETVFFLQKMGALPFIIPAMGSHGRATAEGQTAILKNLGITEESMSCPICAPMEV